MKCKYKLVLRGMQTTEKMMKTMLTQGFSPEVHLVATKLRPRCVDRSLGGSAANWHHPPSLHIGHCKNVPQK
jgi:hypothetical protein